MGILTETIESALDRYRKLRIGQLKNDIDPISGLVDVIWMDGDIGGQSQVQLSYPMYTVLNGQPWGLELGYGKGTIAVFGFLTDNHAVILTTLISKPGYAKGKNGGIKSGEIRITSKAAGQVYLDLQGNVLITDGPANSTIRLNKAGQNITIDVPGGGIKFGVIDTGSPKLTGMKAQSASTFSLLVKGNIELSTESGSSVSINNDGVQIEVGNPANGVTPVVTIGGTMPVLYSLRGDDQPPTDFTEVGVSNTLTVGGPLASPQTE